MDRLAMNATMKEKCDELEKSINTTKIEHSLQQSVSVIAVTKYATLQQMDVAYTAGLCKFGESRMQAAQEKIDCFKSKDIEWHFMGHLQTNKVKKVVQHFDWIQSVDSMRVLEKINDECQKVGKKIKILLQVNTAGETQKSGFDEQTLWQVADRMSQFSCVQIRGLMMIAPFIQDKKQLAFYFSKTKALYDALKAKHSGIDTLSMGMSQDYLLAVANGATMIRVGSYFFGSL